MKKCLHIVATLLVSVLMLPLFMQPAYANEALDYQSTQTVDLINEHTDSQGLIVPVFDSFEDYQTYIDDFENKFGTDGTVQPRSFSCSATAALVPAYIWGQYDLLFSWTGNCLINCWSYTRLQVRHPSYIVSTIYYDQYNGGKAFTRNVTAAGTGTLELARVTLPDDIKQVRLEMDNLRAYDLLFGWQSFNRDQGLIWVLP